MNRQIDPKNKEQRTTKQNAKVKAKVREEQTHFQNPSLGLSKGDILLEKDGSSN
jgi:hypothetical protein